MKAVAGILVSVIISLVLSGYRKEFSVLLILCVCAMVGTVCLGYLEKVMAFIDSLVELGNLNTQLISVLIKSTGIGILAELTAMICTDSGNAALGKVIQLLSCAVILWLCIPLFSQLIELVESVLGAI